MKHPRPNRREQVGAEILEELGDLLVAVEPASHEGVEDIRGVGLGRRIGTRRRGSRGS